MEVVLCSTSMLHALFTPPTFVQNKQDEEGEMIQAVVFVQVFAFNFAITLYPLEVYWA